MSAMPASVELGSPILVSGSVSSTQMMSALSMTYLWGDSQSNTDPYTYSLPVSTMPVANQHTYAATGSYTITVTANATYENGSTDTATLNFPVSILPPASPPPTSPPPPPVSPLGPLPVISVTTANTTEGDSALGFVCFTRTGGDTSNPLVLAYTIGGTASNGTDYTKLSGSVTIPAHELSVEVEVEALPDNWVEASNETVTMTIMPSSEYSLAEGAISITGVVTINDDAPVVSVEWVADAEEGGAAGLFRFQRHGGDLNSSLVASYSTGGTATPLSDYVALAGSVSFPAAESMVSVIVATVDDELEEGDETVTVEVTGGMGYLVGQTAIAVVNIVDNDGPRVELVSGSGFKVAKWQDAFEVQSDGICEIKPPTAVTNLDFIDRDPDRFNVWVYDLTAWNAQTQHIQAKISTKNVADFSAYDDDATAVDLVRYTGGLRGPGWFWSDSQLLVSDDVDDEFETSPAYANSSVSTYLGADNQGPTAVAGLPKNGYDVNTTWRLSDRTHRIALGGKVAAEYVAGGKTYTSKAEVVPVVNNVKVHVTIMNKMANSNPIVSENDAKALLKSANERYAQIGIRLMPTFQTINQQGSLNLSNGLSIPQGLDANGKHQLTGEEADLLSNGRSKGLDDIELYFANYASGINLLGGYAITAATAPDERFADSAIILFDNSGFSTVAHEIGHVLLDSGAKNTHYTGPAIVRTNLMAVNPSKTNTVWGTKRLTVAQQETILGNPSATPPTQGKRPNLLT